MPGAPRARLAAARPGSRRAGLRWPRPRGGSPPPFDAAGMDGIAVRAADTLGASETTPVFLEPGAYDVVDTGDPMPDGRDAVVMREHVHYAGAAAGATELLVRRRPVVAILPTGTRCARSARRPAPARSSTPTR